MMVSSAPQNVEYSEVHFNSNESEAPPSYEAAFAYPAASEAVNFDGRLCDGSACDASYDIDCDCDGD